MSVRKGSEGISSWALQAHTSIFTVYATQPAGRTSWTFGWSGQIKANLADIAQASLSAVDAILNLRAAEDTRKVVKGQNMSKITINALQNSNIVITIQAISNTSFASKTSIDSRGCDLSIQIIPPFALEAFYIANAS